MLQISEPSVGVEEERALAEVIRSGWLTQGTQVREFEVAFAKRHDIPHAVATTSCTTALHLALHALGIGPGDEVIVPAFTWIATANVVEYCGARPVFVDVDMATYNLDPNILADVVGQRTKAVIAVHLFGLCADMSALGKALPKGVDVIEDAACAVGAAYTGRSAGGLGRVACFSFHPRKIVTTGEGGMVTTSDDELHEHIARLRNHGASVPEEVRHASQKPYMLPNFEEIGFNYRMTDLQAAVGICQLAKLDRFLAERRKLAAAYNERLGGIGWLRPPIQPTYADHSWQSYVTLIDPSLPANVRNCILENLYEKGISGRPGTHAVIGLGAYRHRYDIKRDDYPVASLLESHTLALPLHNKMSLDDVSRVADTLRSMDVGSRS